jgi:hypothetical protein
VPECLSEERDKKKILPCPPLQKEGVKQEKTLQPSPFMKGGSRGIFYHEDYSKHLNRKAADVHH